MDKNHSIFTEPNPSPQGVKKFYFLDYFLILLQSVSLNDDIAEVFLHFKKLKEKERLGESKYRKLIIEEGEALSETQVRRYIYTFEQVISESRNCGLLSDKGNSLTLTKRGRECLLLAKEDKRTFYNRLLTILEEKYFAFYHLVNLAYKQNTLKNGLLIFPIYSPLKLGFDKKKMKVNYDLIQYSNRLRLKIEEDIFNFLGVRKNLSKVEKELLLKLIEDGIISDKQDEKFNPKKYNSIISRFRKFWLNYFLKEIYKYPFSFDTFNIWVERGKQLGIIHSTEFYPSFDGRLVYPTSVIVKENMNQDLVKAFNYKNGETLFIHKPDWNHRDNQNDFYESLHNAYFDLKGKRRSNFVRISDLREKVCYKLRIPSFVFNEFLQKAYNQNLKGETQIQISLEADRLPHETTAMYIKREPVTINKQQKNIIAIDYKK